MRVILLLSLAVAVVLGQDTAHKKPTIETNRHQTECRPGCKGLQGERGDTGVDGASGSPGTRGPKGEKGHTLRRPVKIQIIKGDMGFKGMPGPEGVPGRHGLHGAVGAPGFPGLNGRKGVKGHAGYPGQTGPVGPDGAKGMKGDGGVTGPPGLAGFHGERGDSGRPGAPGARGDLGDPGYPGLKGERGAPGSPGDNGADGDTGDRGQTGDTGAVGPQGADGEQGGEGRRGAKGARGPEGLRGLRGEAGDDGMEGNEGQQGDIGPEVYRRLQSGQLCDAETAGEVAYDSVLGKLYFCDGEQWECVRDGGCAGCEEFVSAWSEWTTCSATCGGGTQTRSRDIEVALDFQLANCPLTETRDCNPQTCEVCSEGGQSFSVGDIVHVLQSSDVAADVLLVVDESRSMNPEHAWLPRMVEQLETKLMAQGIGSGKERNLYSLTGFGAGSKLPDQCPTSKLTSTGQRLFPASRYSTVNAQLTTVANGQREDGWHAIKYAIETTPFRQSSGIARNVILVTDEDRDNDCGGAELTKEDVASLMRANGFLLNSVLDQHYTVNGAPGIPTALGLSGSQPNRLTAYIGDGAGSYMNRTNVGVSIRAERPGYNVYTKEDYVDWTLGQGGAVWDLNYLREQEDITVQQSFTSAFVDIKTKEILSQTQACNRCSCVLKEGRPASECIPVASSLCN